MRRRGVRLLILTGVGVAAVATASALAVSATASLGQPARSAMPGPGYPSYQVQRVLSGASLRHQNSHTGKREALSQPAALTEAGGALYAAFDNGVGGRGQARASGNADSTIVQFAPGGTVTAQWDVAGQVAGLTANQDTGEIVATVNEAGHPGIYTIDGGAVAHYRYAKALPSNGGTAGLAFYNGRLLVTASAPGSTGRAAPQAAYPAVYVVTLNRDAHTATAAPYFYDESLAQVANGGLRGGLGAAVKLRLTDPVTVAVVSGRSPRWHGSLVLNSEADQQLIYSPGPGSLWTLRLAQPAVDTAFAPAWHSALYATDPSANAVDLIGHQLFWPGTEFVSVAPCAARGAGNDCKAPYLARLNMVTGELIPVQLGGVPVQPARLTFLVSS